MNKNIQEWQIKYKCKINCLENTKYIIQISISFEGGDPKKPQVAILGGPQNYEDYWSVGRLVIFLVIGHFLHSKQQYLLFSGK